MMSRWWPPLSANPPQWVHLDRHGGPLSSNTFKQPQPGANNRRVRPACRELAAGKTSLRQVAAETGGQGGRTAGLGARHSSLETGKKQGSASASTGPAPFLFLSCWRRADAFSASGAFWRGESRYCIASLHHTMKWNCSSWGF